LFLIGKKEGEGVIRGRKVGRKGKKKTCSSRKKRGRQFLTLDSQWEGVEPGGRKNSFPFEGGEKFSIFDSAEGGKGRGEKGGETMGNPLESYKRRRKFLHAEKGGGTVVREKGRSQ